MKLPAGGKGKKRNMILDDRGKRKEGAPVEEKKEEISKATPGNIEREKEEHVPAALRALEELEREGWR
jgi:hypothetical protein